MKFSLAYFGPEPLFHIRRDFLLAMKYGLESLGHDVNLSGLEIDTTRFNLIMGAYFLQPAGFAQIEKSGAQFAHINTEVIANDMLNHNPAKVDFPGLYLPSLRAGRMVWDVIHGNMAEHERYGNNAHFLRWGWHEKMEDVVHRPKKDLDFYFFGMMSPRRQALVRMLFERKFVGAADGSCPYYLRNDRIGRAKVNLNIVADEKYNHVNCFRVCYLSNNRVSILSDVESDPVGYLEEATVVQRKEDFPDALADLLAGDKWKVRGEAAYQKFREVPMTRCLEELLDASFGTQRGVAAGGGAA